MVRSSGPVRLLLLSFLMLFVELGLIRWLGSNVYYLAYFSNFVLLGSFLGIGLGFLLANRKIDLFGRAGYALAILIALVMLFPIVIDRSGSQLIYFGIQTGGVPMWVALPVVFLATAAVLACIAQETGRVFGAFAPLEAYRIDILGSLGGIVAFTLLSFAGAPPVVWGAIVALLLLALYAPSIRPIHVIAALGIVVMLGRESLDPTATWSPYSKLRLVAQDDGSRLLLSNGIPHQVVQSTVQRRRSEPLYFVPYARLRSNPLNDVMIIGAGTGGDVAIALAQGAKHVDAVEIDPRIYAIGRTENPDRPYASAKVSVHIDDGRAFLERTRSKYDLILLALPDSLSLVSGQSSLRLESYLFTLDAMKAARADLAPHGAFGMYNYYREPWLVDRFANTLETAYGSAPCLDSVGNDSVFALLTVGRAPGDVACATTWHPSAAALPAPVGDDHPFPYLRDAAIPSFYLVVLALIALLSLVSVRVAVGGFAPLRGYADLFCMGAAFMLLETKNVVQFSLLFGTTWLVNALVFAGVLVSVYAATVVAARVRAGATGPLYVALFASLAVAYVVDPATLLALDGPVRFLAAASLAFAPIFIANLIFADRFRSAGTSTVAFGANLLGAMLGGVLEYAALVCGYRDLLVLVALLYGAAFAIARVRLAAKTGPSADSRIDVLATVPR